jgi:hypothetical protein
VRGQQLLICDSKVLKLGYKTVTIRESASASAPGRTPADGTEGLALGRAGFGGSAPKYFQM